jgi:FkbM family methyltransferase
MTIKGYVYRHVRSIANKLGIDIVAYRPAAIENPFNVLEFIVENYLALNRPFTFIQIGANNGVRWDPLRDAILKHHLTGVLVEPLPDMFEQLKQNYADQPQLAFENVAISTENGVQTLFRVAPDADVPDYAHGWASFTRSNLDEFSQFIQEVQVPTLTVKDLLKKHNIDRIALLQVDTEGYDYEIVKMFFREQVLPEIINFESIHLSNGDHIESRKLLKEHGYRFLDIGMDTLAIKGGSPAHP